MLAGNSTNDMEPMEKLMEKPGEKIAEKRRALGRGLDTLLPGAPRASALLGGSLQSGSGASVRGGGMPEAVPRPGQEILQIELDEIFPNPYQTRSRVDDNYLDQLAASIAEHGVMQPVTVRPSGDGKYVLIAGECRWKASRIAKKTTIPAIVRVVSDQQALELTIIENLQREDLNCVDQARAFHRLSEEFQLTQEQIAVRTGLRRSTVSNYLRIVRMPAEVQAVLREGALSFGHAKALMSLNGEKLMVAAAHVAVKGMWSVRRLEEWTNQINAPERGEPKEMPYIDPNVREAQTELERILGVRAVIRDKKGRGSIVLHYRSLEDFDRIVGMLKGE